MLAFLMMMILTINLTMLFMLNLTSKKSFMDREKSSSFECGFEIKSPTRLPFSLQFFLIAVIFLIFDVEITLILPLIMIPKITDPMNLCIFLVSFISILLMGLFHEWNQGALAWAY